MESIRAFVTRTTEEWTPKYKEFTTSYERRVVLIGSTNDKFFLADPEGHRRWLPVTVVCGNPAAIRRDVEQLWAEAMVTYELFGLCYSDAERLAKDEYEAYEVRPRYYDEICEWLQTKGDDNAQNSAREFLRTIDVRRECPGIDSKDRGADWEIGKTLRALGWSHERVRVDGDRFRAWIKTKC
jgi:predicted P-loop ATPase